MFALYPFSIDNHSSLCKPKLKVALTADLARAQLRLFISKQFIVLRKLMFIMVIIQQNCACVNSAACFLPDHNSQRGLTLVVASYLRGWLRNHPKTWHAVLGTLRNSSHHFLTTTRDKN